MTANAPEYSVSEISGALKRTIEDAFGYVRVRGELGRVSRSGNGHCYLDLKDERAVLSSVIWKGSWGRLSIKPEQGMEVIATGRLTTFAGQSRYQLVIDTLEPAGAGALMAMLEERKKKLAAEGLFAAERKRALPRLPAVIGVVTSPTGAVIRDILHRLRDRFPSHVIVWPTAVQGVGAATQIAAGIEGFNHLMADGPVSRPDVLIVARGGGSLEDLWEFNDEAVVRAVAESRIPVISAVGHETDTTLIDYAADVRAPTPTAAAEMAVPVRMDLLKDLANREARLTSVLARRLEQGQMALQSASRGLGRPDQLLETAEQRFDRAADGLVRSLGNYTERARQKLAMQTARLTPRLINQRTAYLQERLSGTAVRLRRLRFQKIDEATRRLEGITRLLVSLSYKGVLERGYALVLNSSGKVLREAGQEPDGADITLRFADGDRAAILGTAEKASSLRISPKKSSKSNLSKDQATLFDD